MASIKKEGKTWRAQVRHKGKARVKRFGNKAEAQQWAIEAEHELRTLAGGVSLTHTVKDVFERYAREVSPTKSGAKWELLRLDLLLRDQQLARIKLIDLRPDDIGQWRDRRLAGTDDCKAVSGSTVNREMNLMSHAFNTAAKEWGWLRESPTKSVRRPKEAPPRDRLITDQEAKQICFRLGFDGNNMQTVGARVGAAFMFAIQTGMRAGEIAALRKGSVVGNVAKTGITKNGTRRDVPLSTEALRLWTLTDNEGFNVTSTQISANFAKCSKLAGVEDVTFHDSRHRAVTDLSKKIDILALAKMIGHKDLKQLQVYYDRPAEDIAADLD